MTRWMITSICFLMASSAMAESSFTGPRGEDQKLVVLKKAGLPEELSPQAQKSLANIFKVLPANPRYGLEKQPGEKSNGTNLTDATTAPRAVKKNPSEQTDNDGRK